MSVRLVISMQAKPGKGAEMLAEMEKRCVEVRKEPGCLQFEAFLSGNDPTASACSSTGRTRLPSMSTPGLMPRRRRTRAWPNCARTVRQRVRTTSTTALGRPSFTSCA